jgi:hypothetical protein
MKGKHVFQRVISTPRYDIPASLSREIGRVIVRWAYFEEQLQSLIWAIVFDCAEDGAALGRLAVRELRIEQRADLLADIANVRRVAFDKALLRAIKRKALDISRRRNLLAHGGWTFRPDTGWLVRETRGSWEEQADGPRGKRSITPQPVPVSTDDVRRTVAELEKLISDATKLRQTFLKTTANSSC